VVEVGETVYVTDRAAWRAWLKKHHRSKREVWLVFYSRASGKPGIPYNDAVEEALCFGWIDSIVKKLDEDGARAQRFTPRRPGSRLSEMNRERVRRLFAARRMTKAGLAAIGPIDEEPFALPEDIERALRADPAAWRHFQRFPMSYKRIRVGWIDASRRRPAVFKQRLDYFVAMTARNKRFGMVQ
jgi:uncharacterized protein YdeI (YjbR/CyaY-like superfamily)